MNQITPMIDNSGTEYDIPKNEVKEFQADMGTGAQRQYLYRTEDGTDYAIPESESKDFLADFPNAQPVRRFQFADGTTEDVPANELKAFFSRYETEDKYKPDRDIRDAKKAELEAKFKKINAEADSPLWAGIKEGFASFGRYLWNPAQEYRERFGEDNIGTQMFTGADDAANSLVAGVVKIPSGIEKVFGYGLGGRSTKVGNYFINDAQGFEAAVDRTLPQNKKAEFMDGEALEWANRVQNMSSTLFNFTLAGGAGAAGAPTIVAIDSTDQYIDNYDRAIARGAKPEEANAIATEAFMWNAILEGTLINGGIKPMHKGAQKLAVTPTLDLTKPTFSGITRGLTVGTLRNYAAKTTGHILSTGAIMGTDAMGKELLRQDAEGEERNWTKAWEAGKVGGEEGALMGLMFGTASGLTAASEFRMYHKAMKKTFGDLAMKNIGTAQGREMMSKVNPKGTYDFLKAREDGGTPSRKQADRMILPDDLSAAERAKIADDFLHDGITPESIKAEMEAKKPGPKPTDIEAEVVEPKKTALPGPETGVEPPAEAPKGAETPESGAVAPVGASEVARVGETTPEAPKAVEAVSGASAEGAAAAGAAKPGVQPAETPPETPLESPAEAHAPVLSGDEVRKTMPGYDPKNWRTHVDKSGYVAPRMEKQFQELLSTRNGKGNGEVVFLAGGNGSGKSTLVEKLGSTPDFIVDSTLGNLKTAKKQIDAVLANGQKPVIDYVYRAPEEALEGVVERVENGGHVVSPLSFADSHTNGIKNLRLLADEYGDKISVHVIDNSAEGSPEITLEQLEAKGVPDHAEIRKRANEVLGQYGTLDGDGGTSSVRGGGGEVKGAEAQKGDGKAGVDRDQGRADGREAQGEGGGADKGAVAVDRTGVPDWLDDEGVAEIFKAGNFIDGWGSAVSAFFRHRVRTDEKLAELRRQYDAETDEAKRKKLNNQYKKRVNELWEHQGTVQPQDEMRDAVNAIQKREGSTARANGQVGDERMKQLTEAAKKRASDVKELTGSDFDEFNLTVADLMKFRKLHENYAKGADGAEDALKKFVAEKASQKNPEIPDKPTTPETAPAAEAEKPVAVEAPKNAGRTAGEQKAGTLAQVEAHMQAMGEITKRRDAVDSARKEKIRKAVAPLEEARAGIRAQISALGETFDTERKQAKQKIREELEKLPNLYGKELREKSAQLESQYMTPVIERYNSQKRKLETQITGIEAKISRIESDNPAAPNEHTVIDLGGGARADVEIADESLKRFRAATNNATTVLRVEKSPTPDKMEKAMKPIASEDATRKSIMQVHREDGVMVATDGRMAFQYVNPDIKKDAIDEYPNWRQVFPKKEFFTNDPLTVDLKDLFDKATKANIFTSSRGDVKDSVPMMLLTPDGKGGAKVDFLRTNGRDVTFSTTDNPKGAVRVAMLNPEFVVKTAKAVAASGEDKVKVFWKDDHSPVLFDGENCSAVMMPMRRLSGGALDTKPISKVEGLDEFYGKVKPKEAAAPAEAKAELEKPVEPAKSAEAKKSVTVESATPEDVAQIMADRYNQLHAKDANPQKAEPSRYMKTAELLLKNIRAKNADGLISTVANGLNPGSLRAFEVLTGIKMPRSQRDQRIAIDKYCGITPEDRAKIEADRKAEADAKAEAERKANALAEGERIAKETRVRLKSGEVTTAQKLLENGWTIKKSKRGAVTNLHLVAPDKSGYFRIDSKAFEYAEDFIAKRAKAAEKPDKDGFNEHGNRKNENGDWEDRDGNVVQFEDSVPATPEEMRDTFNVTSPRIKTVGAEWFVGERGQPESVQDISIDGVRAGYVSRREAPIGTAIAHAIDPKNYPDHTNAFVLNVNPVDKSGAPIDFAKEVGTELIEGEVSYNLSFADEGAMLEAFDKLQKKFGGAVFDFSKEGRGRIREWQDKVDAHWDSVYKKQNGWFNAVWGKNRNQKPDFAAGDKYLAELPAADLADILALTNGSSFTAKRDLLKALDKAIAAQKGKYLPGGVIEAHRALEGDNGKPPDGWRYLGTRGETFAVKVPDDKTLRDYIEKNFGKIEGDIESGVMAGGNLYNVNEILLKMAGARSEVKPMHQSVRDANESTSITPQAKLDTYRDYAKAVISRDGATIADVRDAMYNVDVWPQGNIGETGVNAPDIFFNRLQAMMNDAFRADSRAQGIDAKYRKAESEGERQVLADQFRQYQRQFADNFLKTRRDEILKAFDEIELKPGETVEDAAKREAGVEQKSIGDEAKELADDVDAAIDAEEAEGGDPAAPANAPRGRGTGALPQDQPKSHGPGTKGRKIVTPQTFLRRAQELFPDVAFRRKNTVRMPNWAAAHFEPAARIIRAKDMNAIGDVSHELGHDIEHLTRYDVPKLPAVKRDLSDLGHQLYGPGTPKPPSYIGEGFAEYVRGYILNAPNLHQVAPDLDDWFNGAFKQKHPDIVKKLDELRDMVQTMKEQSAAQTVGGFMRPSTETITRAWKKTLDFFSGENWNDSASIILRGMKKSGIARIFHWQDDFRKLEASKDPAERRMLADMISDKIENHPYIFATITRGTASQRVMDMARHGTTSLLGNKKTGESLKDIFADFSPAEREDWKLYAVAKHGIVNYYDKGLGFGLPRDVLEEVVQQYESPKFQDALRRYTDYSHRILHLGVDAGLISQDTYDKIVADHPIYVRITRRYAQDGAGTRQGGQAINRRTGGFDHILDPIDAALMDQEKFLRACFQAKTLQLIIKAGERATAENVLSITTNGGPNRNNMNPQNEAHNAVGANWPVRVPNAQEAVKFSSGKLGQQLSKAAKDFAAATGADPIPLGDFVKDLTEDNTSLLTIFREKPSYGKHNLVSVYVDGELQTYELPDMKWANMLTDVYDKSEFKWFEKAAGIATAGVRLGATVLNPEFAIRNGIRDSLHSAVMSESGAVPGVSTLNGMLQQLLGSEAAELFRAMGGHMSDLVGVTKEQKWNHGGKVALAQNAFQTIRAYTRYDWALMKPVVKACADVLSLPELGPRVREMSGIMAKCRKAGLSDDACAILGMSHAKDISIDFQRAGRYMRRLNHFVPFINATWRGTEQFARNHGLLPALPHQFEDRNLHRARNTALRSLAFVTSWVATLAMLEMSGDEKDRRKAFERTPEEKWDYEHIGDWRFPSPFEIGSVYGAIAKAIIYEMHGDKGAIAEALSRIPQATALKYLDLFETIGSSSLISGEFDIAANKDYRKRPIVPEHIRQNKIEKDWYTQYTTEFSKKLGELFNTSPALLEYRLDSASGGLYRRIALFADNANDWSRYEDWRNWPGIKTLKSRPQANRLISDFYDRNARSQQELGSGVISLPDFGRYKMSSEIEKQLTEKFDEIRTIRADKSIPLAEQDRRVDEVAEQANEIIRTFNARDDYRERGISYAASELTEVAPANLDDATKAKYLELLKGIERRDVEYALRSFGREIITTEQGGKTKRHRRWSIETTQKRIARLKMLLQD